MVQDKSRPIASKPVIGLTPDEIRRIRESLGLSQVEAGELLGGGPRAFTKYESGTIKPAASVANLLRLLEANPGTLSTLTGSRMAPMDTEGARPFEVTGQHVSALTDRKLANLTRRLLTAEAYSSGLPMDRVHVAANITAPDGGEDARIEWSGGPERTVFLPHRLCQFQLKATTVTPAQAAAEVLTSDRAVKPMIRGVLEAGGTYIMLCARSHTKREIKAREDKLRASLLGAGLSLGDEQVQFRDASQIADWVNAHPSVAVWVLEQTQPVLAGPLRTWSHWAGRFEHESSPWVADARLVPFRAQLRALVTPLRGVARVVGLSGIGKSRLTLEGLGPTDEEEASSLRLSDLVLYVVGSEAGPTQIKHSVQVLADVSLRALVVVDRCPEDIHQDLAAMVRRSGSRLSLVTIDHEIPKGTLRENTLLVETADSAVIEGVLSHVAPGLPSEDQGRLVKFADGCPQFAVLIGRSWMEGAPVALASNDTLIDQIILGRSPKEPALVQDAAMLLSTFALVGAEPPMDEDLARIATFSRDRTIDDLRVAFDELGHRGVVQRRGRLVTLQPLPIALALAERQWRRWGPSHWDEVLTGSVPEHLKTSAASQLALLSKSEIATKVTRYVCRLKGPLSSMQGLARPGNAEALSSLAEIDTEAVVALLERALKPLADADLKAVNGDLRRHLVWTLEKVTFVACTFEEGANLLLDLAATENETWANNATGQFKALFPVLLGNTEADGEARLRMLDGALSGREDCRLRIVADALLEGARTHFFSRCVGPEIRGEQPALEPWSPQTYGEAWSYVRGCLKRLTTLAARPDDLGAYTKKALGRTFRFLVSQGLIDAVESSVATVTCTRGHYWPEALSSLGDILVYDRKHLELLEPDVEKRVRTLIEALTPKKFADRVRLLVTEMPWNYPVGENLDSDTRKRCQSAAVDQLVADLLLQPEALSGIIPQLSRGQQRMSRVFGQSLAEQAPDPLVWRDPIVAAVEATTSQERNFQLLAGYFCGLAEREPQAVEAFKEEAACSDVFAPALPLICWRIGIREHDVHLVCTGLDAGLIPPSAIGQWSFGGALAQLSSCVLAPLFDRLFTKDDQAYSVALDVLVMYAYGNANRLEDFRAQLRLAASVFDRGLKMRGTHAGAHNFEYLMVWILAKGREDSDARAVAMTLARGLIESVDDHAKDFIQPLLPKLLSGFPEIVWPLLGQAIVSGRMKAWRFQHLLKISSSFHQDPPILHLPEDTLFAWCHAHPEVAPAFVAAILPMLTAPDSNVGDRKLHPVTKRLLDKFGDREDVLSGLSDNLHTFSCMGSRTTYYALYEQPLRDLESHPIGAVRRWTKRMLNELNRQIKAARDEDEENGSRWTS